MTETAQDGRSIRLTARALLALFPAQGTMSLTALTLPVLVADGKPLGMDPAQWDALARWMKDQGLVKTDVSGSAAVDTSLLPEASQ